MRDFVVLGQFETGLSAMGGTIGLGTNPTNPWCQRPRRPPPKLSERVGMDPEFYDKAVQTGNVTCNEAYEQYPYRAERGAHEIHFKT